MIDYLFLGPLGWDENIWNKLVMNLEGKTYDFINYFDHDDICTSYLINELKEKINTLKDTGTIIACSYGSRFLLYSLDKLNIQKKRIILIEGFDEIKDIDSIKSYLDNRREEFETVEEYLDIMADEKEKEDYIIKQCITKTLIKHENTYKVKCNNNKMIKYLSILSEIDNYNLINNLKRKNNNEYIIFSSSMEIGDIPYIKISEKEHLLMLSSPQKIELYL